MKKTTARILLIFMVLTMAAGPLFSLISFADGQWSEDYYRASSSTGDLSDDERNDLDAAYIEFMSEHGVDFAALAINSERLDENIEDFALHYFQSCDFGYGNHRTGFMMMLIADTEEIRIVPINGAEKFLDAGVLELAEMEAGIDYAIDGEYGAMIGALNFIAEEIGENEAAGKDAVPALGADQARPDWYPSGTTDISNFQFFSDENAPRVVDNADLLTDEEEADLEDMIATVIKDTGHDLVVVTDVTDYGLGQMGFADDFFDYNGYGIGSEREGALFFCDMDPNDRGGWCSCHGSDTRALYTESVANNIDDIVYNYLGQGEYSKAFNSWVSLMYFLFDKGDPFAPDWMPSRGETVTRTQDASAPRVMDDCDLFSDAQEDELEAKISEISSKYGVDVILFSPGYMCTMSTREYGRALYQYCGYGLGQNYDAVIMSIRNGVCYADAFGSTLLTDVNQDRIEEKAESAYETGGAYEAALSYLKDVEHMLRTGRVQKPIGAWIASTIAGLLGGSVFGGISAGSAQSKMKTPRTATTAEDYLVRNSININVLYDNYLGTTTNRVYNPPEERTSSGGGGGGGGHSSYSGGHTSSSGSTHSGSGRKF